MRRNKEKPLFENVLITDVAAEGKALARVNDKVLFVPFAVPGDVVNVQVTRKRTSYMDNGTLDINNYDIQSLYGVKFGMDKKTRIITHESGSSHGMAIVGVDVDSTGKTTKWQFENSWGATAGQDGLLVFTDDWFSDYLFRLVVNQKYIPENIKKILVQKPTMLPPCAYTEAVW